MAEFAKANAGYADAVVAKNEDVRCAGRVGRDSCT
jgi:hypothetical protein